LVPRGIELLLRVHHVEVLGESERESERENEREREHVLGLK
jgi:hypothetical protein